MLYKYLFLLIIYNNIFSLCNKSQIIISLTSNINNLKILNKAIYSILEQNVNKKLYKFLLILFKKEKREKIIIPKESLLLFNIEKIKVVLLKNKFNLQSRLVLAIKKYPMNPILIVSANIYFPEGWLEMIIKDHIKYPNDIITCSIQYYFGKNLTIREFSEGFKGKYFGTYNHVSNIIFNFAIINSELGGTLYPPGIFKNKKFYSNYYFIKISKESDEFWQSCFIIIEDKILRQSSKIYDYTQFLITNKSLIEKKFIFEKIKIKFIKYFPSFQKIVELRQQKILISLTSYYERFGYLNSVIESLKKQILLPKKILLILYEKDFTKFDLNITDIEIIKVKEDIKSHKKYYYTMKDYRNYAIITLDDDIYYPSDVIVSLYESYINHPNIISGRRTHLIKYKKNLLIDKYLKWKLCQTTILFSDYNLFITTGAGALYPPDILNIDHYTINIINETITTDDITLKYFEIKKGVESIWVPNKLMMGLAIKKKFPKIINKPLYNTNIFLNDININKLNIDISNKIIKNCCIQYKNIKSGLFIHLFNINNINIINDNKTLFEVEAYSYCPIDSTIKFQIFFNISIVANCFFNYAYSFVYINFNIYKTKKILKAKCLVHEKIKNLDKYYFPFAKSNDTLHLNIYNKRKYLYLIYHNFYCKNSFTCILTVLSYKNIEKGYKINININKKNYICLLNNKIIYLNNHIPSIAKFLCKKSFFNYKYHQIPIGGIKYISINKNENFIDDIPNQFTISKIFIENTLNYTFILIEGILYKSLIKNLSNLSIFVTFPKLYLNCYLKNSSNYIQSNMKCYTKRKIKGEILIENQIIRNKKNELQLLILNKITLLQNYEILGNFSAKDNKNSYLKYLYIIIKKFIFQNLSYISFIIFIFLKFEKKSYLNLKNFYI